MNYTEQVFCTLQVEGIHRWKDCPFDEVFFLRDFHRHLFHIKAYKTVTHSDRDVEFIMLKREIQDYLATMYTVQWGKTITAQDRPLHLFGDRSCEMIAKDLIEKFGLSQCEVNEDGENGAIVTVIPTNEQQPTTQPLSEIECPVCGEIPVEGCKTC